MNVLRSLNLFACAAALVAAAACSSSKEAGGRNPDDVLIDDARSTVTFFKQKDPSIDRFFSSAKSYVVFPQVTQGGAGIGAAHGRGVLFRGGSVEGFAEVSAGSIGATLGGQSYSEIIFLQSQLELDRFKRGETKFSAQASAVAASAGAAAQADYAEGVAVFVGNQSGLMFDASVGGQGFKYRPR